MLQSLATSYEISNGYCYVDGILQESTQVCSDNIGAAAGILAIFAIPLVLIGIALFVVWIITLIHVIKHHDVPNRTLWIVLHFIGAPQLAALIYLFVVKRPYDKKAKAGIGYPAPQQPFAPQQPAIPQQPIAPQYQQPVAPQNNNQYPPQAPTAQQ